MIIIAALDHACNMTASSCLQQIYDIVQSMGPMGPMGPRGAMGLTEPMGPIDPMSPIGSMGPAATKTKAKTDPDTSGSVLVRLWLLGLLGLRASKIPFGTLLGGRPRINNEPTGATSGP